jgi:hypothetical protein
MIMHKNHIIQFVGFNTTLPFNEFNPQWEKYSRDCKQSGGAAVLLEDTDSLGRYKFLSQHHCDSGDFKFAFMKGRNSEHFPDQKVKVVLAGGYIATQMATRHYGHHDDKIIAFLGHNENDLSFYKQLSEYSHLNIYQAYFENCIYGNILEFFAPEIAMPELSKKLKQRQGVEAMTYRECTVSVA